MDILPHVKPPRLFFVGGNVCQHFARGTFDSCWLKFSYRAAVNVGVAADVVLEREQAQTWPEPEPKPEPEPEPGPEHEPELEPGPGPGPDHDASAAEEFRRILQATVGSDTTTKSIPFDVAKFEVIDDPPKKMCKLKCDSHP